MNIVKLMDDLEQNAETSFEREVIHEEEDSFQLTSSQLKALKDLHDSVSISFVGRSPLQVLWC